MKKDICDSNIKSNYVEAFIVEEKERITDAYLSIDIKEKTGYEIVPADLIEYLSSDSKYVGIKKFFKNNKEKEVYITDDYHGGGRVDIVGAVLRAIVGKDVLVHVRVRADYVDEAKRALDITYNDEIQEDILFIKWLYTSRDYLIHLYKSLSGRNEYTLRLNKDGNGVIIYIDERISTKYFKIDVESNSRIFEQIDDKIDYIVNHPGSVSEDDRFFGFPVHLKYNIYQKYKNANDRLGRLETYEDSEYSDDEYKIKIAKMILSLPEIKRYWMKMHI